MKRTSVELALKLATIWNTSLVLETLDKMGKGTRKINAQVQGNFANTQKVSTKSDTKIVCNSSIAFKNEFAITIRFMEIWKEG